MENILEETNLTTICANIRNILENDTAISAKINDTQKGLGAFVSDKPLKPKAITRDYALSCFHLCQEMPTQDISGVELIEGKIYIDCFRKINSKEGNIFNELDKFAWTVLKALRQAPEDLNSFIYNWKFKRKDPVPIADEDIDKPVLSLICSITISVFYDNAYSAIS